MADGIPNVEDAMHRIGPPAPLFEIGEVHTLEELRDNGVLWMINRQVFWPYGVALALVYNEGKVIGWKMVGSGLSPIITEEDETRLLDKFNNIVASHLDAACEADIRREGSP